MKKKHRVLKTTFIVIGVVLGFVIGCAIWLYHATHVVPHHYRLILGRSQAEQAEASDEMLKNVSTLVSNAQKADGWSAAFTQDEINGWLAVDLVENHRKSIPPNISDPRVLLADEAATLMFRVEDERIEGVISIGVDLYMDQPDVLAVRLRETKLGNLALPKKYFLDMLSEELKKIDLPVRWQQADGDPVALISLDIKIDDQSKQVIVEQVAVTEDSIQISGHTEKLKLPTTGSN